MTVFLVFVGLILLLLTGMPIFAALGLTATIILLIFEGSISSIGDTVFSHLNKDLLATIPLFVLMAQIMIRAKVIDDLYDFANTVVGHVKGGLGVATVMACTIFAAISGSSVATALATRTGKPGCKGSATSWSTASPGSAVTGPTHRGSIHVG